MLPLAKPNLDGAGKLLQECIDTGWVSSQGPFVKQFENAFAQWIGSKYAVSCSSGTTALHLALKALGIGPEDEVIVPSFTFIATANAVTYCGAKPVFCDVSNSTWCLNLEDLARRITPKTRAVVPVHINGYPAPFPGLKWFAQGHGLKIVEDACQALGSEWSGLKLGTWGDIGCFSFFANKVLTTGEGGMCTTDDKQLADRMQVLRDHGRNNSYAYVHDVIGFNYRMTNLQAAVGLAQLEHLEREVARRKALHEKWRQALGNTQPKNEGQCPWLYHYRVKCELDSEKAIAALAKVGIESKPFYRPVHMQLPYLDSVRLPVSEGLCGVMLPLHREVTEEYIELAKTTLAQVVALR